LQIIVINPLCTGTAATFVLSGSNLHLVRVFNEDFGAKGSVTNYINVSFDGNYLAVGWRSKYIAIYYHSFETIQNPPHCTMIHHQNALAMFLASAFTLLNFCHFQYFQGVMPLIRALVRNMVAAINAKIIGKLTKKSAFCKVSILWLLCTCSLQKQ
jgi:hypothetical protein